MRDELDARLWVAHHHMLAAGLEKLAAVLRSGAARLAVWDGSSHHLLALILSFTVTAITFNTTAT